MAESGCFHYGMLEAGHVVACALAIPVLKSKAKIRQMTVAPEYQKQGIGRLLLENIERELKQRGVTSVELDARSTAIGFYEKLGYVGEGVEFIAVSIPHLRMVKSLVSE